MFELFMEVFNSTSFFTMKAKKTVNKGKQIIGFLICFLNLTL